MAELADAHDSNSCAFGHVGSIPTFGIKSSPVSLVSFLFNEFDAFRKLCKKSKQNQGMIVLTMKNPQLEIRLLGPVEISYDGKPVKIPRRAERGILYFLAIENRPVSRETLIDLLWPKAEQVDPRGTLRTALSRLRNSLPDKTLLITELDQVSVDFSRCFVDLVKFTISYQSLQGLLSAFPNNQPLPVQIVNQIAKSLDLWQGDRIIEGDDLSDYPELEAWCQGLDKDLGLRRVFLMRYLAAHYRASGQLQTALDLFVHLGRLNNQDIASHLAVIDILMKLSRHQEAQEFCDSLEVIFEREYNAPLPEEIIQRCRESQKLIKERSGRGCQKWPIPSSFNVPLVGRTAELAQLKDAFFRGGLVKIEGEMGVGKTRLVKELFETLSPKPLLILAPGRENETALPLAPIIHGLRRHIPDEIWKEIDGVWASQLSILLPELKEIRDDCSPSMTGKLTSASQHLFDALHQLLKLVGRKYGRILFFLDDAQWVDRQTTAALFYLVMQGFFDEYGALIVASRFGEHNNDIDVFFDQQRRTGHVEVITVVGLNPEELSNLVHHVLSQPISPSFLEGVYRETRGIPFWTLEIMRHLLDRYGETKALQDVTQFPLTKSAHAFIRNRFYRFKKESRYILSCAAVIGDDIPLALLQSVSDMSQQDFLMALDPLVQSRFLATNRIDHVSVEERLTFTHEKLREVVLLEMNTAHQQVLHQRVANELAQASDALERAAIIAEHFRAGGDSEMAFKWHLKAAAHAWNLGAARDVVRSFQQAEEIFTQSPKGIFKVDDLFNLYYQWSDFAYQSNQVTLLEELGVKLQRLSKKKPGCSMEGLSNLILAKACFLWEDFETGLLLSQRAVRDLPHSSHFLAPKVQAFFLQALFEWWTLDLENVFASGDRILTLVNGSELDASFQTTAQFLARRMICDAYIAQGEANTALQLAQKNFQQYFNKLNTFDQLRAYNMLANAYYIAGNYTLCHKYAEEGLRIAQVLDNAIIEMVALIILCKAEIVLGHLDDAFQHATLTLKLAERHHKIQSIVAANTLLGVISAILFDDDQALHHYRIAQVRQGYSIQSYYGLENNINLTRLLALRGELVEARELLETTLAVTEQKRLMAFHIEALMVEGVINLEEGDFIAAGKVFSMAVSIAEKKGLVQEVMWGTFRLAWAAFLQGQYNLAEESLVKVLSFTRLRDMVILNKLALELAINLSRIQTLSIPLDQLREEYQALVAKLEAHTRSEALRARFLAALQRWREYENFP